MNRGADAAAAAVRARAGRRREIVMTSIITPPAEPHTAGSGTEVKAKSVIVWVAGVSAPVLPVNPT